jgi:1-acyl-sn-glycerol-3-phosphate acyltransferase
VRVRYRLSWWFANFVARVFLGLKIEGREHIPKSGGVLVACNHISYWDPPLLGVAFNRELFYMAKKELFRNRFFGALIRFYNAIPVSRDAFSRGALEKAVEVVRSGNAIVIFPEGRRSDPSKLGEPKPGLGMVADKTGCPVVPAFVTGSDTMKRCLVRRRSLKVHFGPAIRPAEFDAKGGEGKEKYTRISRVAMDRVALLKERAQSAG